MIKGDVLEIGQAFYGSFSGYHDYRILAASPAGASGFSREDREIISLRSNLGGSAQTVPRFDSFFTFYDLGRQRPWAFSRTVWLSRGPRGNDYLVHVLAISAEVMEALRGDPFLLLRLFNDVKPLSEEALRPLQLPVKQVLEQAMRPCGADLDERIKVPVLAGLLRTIARGTGALAFPLDDHERAVTLCRSIISALPPDDREGLSFCSRFSLPRRAAFRLAVYSAEDAPLADRYLDGPISGATPGSDDSFTDWAVACQNKEIEPFYRMSLAKVSKGNAANAPGVLKVVQKLGRKEDLSSTEEDLLEPVVLDRRNHCLPSIHGLIVPLAWKAVRRIAGEVVSAKSSLARLKEACQRIWSLDSRGKFLEEMISNSGSTQADLTRATAILTLALSAPKAELARPDLILMDEGRAPALFRAGQLTGWLLGMSKQNPEVCRQLLIDWFKAWFQSGAPIIQPVLTELRQPQSSGQLLTHGAASMVFKALWEAVSEEAAHRDALWADLLSKGYQQLVPPLSIRDIAALALRKSLLASLLTNLREGQAPSLLRSICRDLPSETETWLKQERPTKDLLLALAGACRDGLAGEWPDLGPQRAKLAVLVIEELLALTKREPQGSSEALAGLLYQAVGRVVVSNVLATTFEARLSGGADLGVLDALILARLGDRTAVRAAVTNLPNLSTQIQEDFCNGPWNVGSPDWVWGSTYIAEMPLAAAIHSRGRG